jgi:hypothetical protein
MKRAEVEEPKVRLPTAGRKVSGIDMKPHTALG